MPNVRPGRQEPGARPDDPPNHIRGDCPVCGRDTLKVSLGAHRNLTWSCYAECDLEDIRLALINKHQASEDCLPPLRPDAPKRKRRSDAEVVRELRDLLERPVNGNAFRLQAAMLLLDLDAGAAADRLGIPERTRRRLLCP